MHKPKAEWVKDDEKTLPNQSVNLGMKNHVGGRVWLETSDIRVDGPDMTGSDVAASGYNVVMSVLTPEGIGEYAAKVETLPLAQQQAAAKQLLKEHPEYIAETVTTKTDAKGYYSVKFSDGKLTKQSKKYLYAHVESPDGKPVIGYSGWRLPLYQSPEVNGGQNPQPIAAENLVANPMWYNVNFALVPRHNVSLDITNYDMTKSPARKGDKPVLDVKGPFPVTPNKIVWKKNGKEFKTCEGITTEAQANQCVFTVPEDAVEGDVFTAEFVTGDDTTIAADSFVVTEKPISDELTPEYEDGSGKPGEDVKVDKPVFKDGDGKETTPPEGTKFTPGENAPEGVTVDESTGEITVPVPEDAKPGDKITVPVEVTYPDGSKDTVDVTVTVDEPDVPAPSITAGSETDEVPADGSEKTLDDKVENPTDGMTGEVLDKDGNPIKDATVTVDPDTGEIKVTVPEGTAPQDGKVVVKDKNGDKVGEVDVKITEPKTDVPDTSNASVVPDTVTVVEGQEAKPFEVAKNIPEGGKVVVDGLPDGLSVDESTGEVTGTPAQISDWGKDEEERAVEVTVSVTDKDGKEVAQGTKTVTVQRDTDGDGQPDVTDTDDDNDGATDAEEAAAGTDPKDASSKPEAKPGDDQGATSVDKSGVKDVKPSGEDQNTGIKVTKPDEGTKVSATDKDGKDVPAKIDDNGNVVVTPGQDVEGPITVVIEDEDLDGGKTEVEVGVKGEKPGNQGGSSNLPDGSSLPGLSSGSSNVDWKRCAPAAAGVGIPLLFLLPIGLASQMNIPGFSPLVKQVSAQIDGINRQLAQQNTALQKQLGIYNGPLAKQASQIDLMLKKVSPEAGRIGGGIALAAAGALALGLLINSCAPGAGSSSSSSSSK